MLTGQSTVIVAADQVWCDLDGEAAILNLRTGVYYGLSQVGACVWGLLQEPVAIDSIVRAVAQEYDVDHERCRRDVLVLVGNMAAAGLVDVRDGTNA